MGVSWMVSLGAAFVLADAGAAPSSDPAWRAISIARLPSAANRMVKRVCEILLMSFSCSTVLHSGTDGTFPYVMPGSTLRPAIRSKFAPPAGFVKRGAGFDKPPAWLAPVNRLKRAGERLLHRRH